MIDDHDNDYDDECFDEPDVFALDSARDEFITATGVIICRDIKNILDQEGAKARWALGDIDYAEGEAAFAEELLEMVTILLEETIRWV